MPLECELDAPKRLVVSRAWGSLTDGDLLSHRACISELFAQGSIDASWRQLVDFTDVASFDSVSTFGIQQMAGGNPWPGGSVRVLVVPKDLEFGLARMYQSFVDSGSGGVRLARSLDEGLDLVANAAITGPEAT